MANESRRSPTFRGATLLRPHPVVATRRARLLATTAGLAALGVLATVGPWVLIDRSDGTSTTTYGLERDAGIATIVVGVAIIAACAGARAGLAHRGLTVTAAGLGAVACFFTVAEYLDVDSGTGPRIGLEGVIETTVGWGLTVAIVATISATACAAWASFGD